MYRFSLSSFVPLFKRALSTKTLERVDINKRIDMVSEALEKNILEYVARSVFKADRLMFAMHLVHLTKPNLFQPKVLVTTETVINVIRNGNYLLGSSLTVLQSQTDSLLGHQRIGWRHLQN